MVRSRRKSTATRAKFQTELVVAAITSFVLFRVACVTVGPVGSALSEADNACTAGDDAPDRQKDTCVAARLPEDPFNPAAYLEARYFWEA